MLTRWEQMLLHHPHISLYFNIKWKLISFPTKYQSNATHSWNITVEVQQRCFIVFFFTGLFLAIFLPKLLLYLTTSFMKSVGLFCKVFLLILGHFMVMKTQKMAFKYFASKSKVSWENKSFARKRKCFCEQMKFFSGTH